MSARLSPESPVAAKVFPSPNHGERKGGQRPNMLVLHYTGMPDAGEALQWLCNPVAQVSAHYFVFEDGRVVQTVPEARRAWHAGVSYWDGDTDINSCSIGIEIANPGHPGGLPPFPDALRRASWLVVDRLAYRATIRWRTRVRHRSSRRARRTGARQASRGDRRAYRDTSAAALRLVWPSRRSGP